LWVQLTSHQKVFFWCSGLAWAICEHLVEVIKAPTLFATHFHELTALTHENPDHEPHKKQNVGVANYHVSAHIDSSSRKLTMLFKVDAHSNNMFRSIKMVDFRLRSRWLFLKTKKIWK
jgi:DNA mismatch repair protein MSH2